MPYGYNGQILRVDLSKNTLKIENPPESFYRRYFGGRAMIAYYLLKELKPGIDPLGPENLLVFIGGIATGTPVLGTARSAVGAKSPLTGGFGESQAGGFWGKELIRAGFDGIIVKGRAKSPVYLWVYDGEFEVRDAAHIWGLDTADSQELIRKDLGDKLVRVAQIGRGGENKVRYASIANDVRHFYGRTGMGAVMGSKNLKAIATRGNEGPPMADLDTLSEINRRFSDDFQSRLDQGFIGLFPKYGTSYKMEDHWKNGNLSIRNFRDYDDSSMKIFSSITIMETVGVRMEGCYGCAIHCKKVVQVEEPWKVDPVYGGPEYESTGSLGTNCGIDDVKAICKANELCQRYTLDTISTGVTIGFAMECFENGLLTKKDTGGIDLSFGNAEAMVQMVEMIAGREGLGDLLAEGTKRAAEKIGGRAKKFAIHVKGMEVPMHDPRLQRGLALGFSVNPAGPDHMNTLHDSIEQLKSGKRDFPFFGVFEPIPIEDVGPRKVRLFVYVNNWEALKNCLLTCGFVPLGEEQILEMVRAATGWYTSIWELMKVGERSVNMARAFNIREGFTRKDDWLPDRFFHPKTSGPLSKRSLNATELEEMKSTYYGMMNWDQEKGTPTRPKLEELDIAWVADELKLK
ncbi:aldehyde ferredoxin oxidoreductase family protein [Candidatus Bathyarchaeota archaeon]|nr:aldehyde ferredoxin oxidoreductase family protein [Candidatus Bathyarchaeota archaeon]